MPRIIHWDLIGLLSLKFAIDSRFSTVYRDRSNFQWTLTKRVVASLQASSYSPGATKYFVPERCCTHACTLQEIGISAASLKATLDGAMEAPQ